MEVRRKLPARAAAMAAPAVDKVTAGSSPAPAAAQPIEHGAPKGIPAVISPAHEALAAFTESQAAVARGLEAMTNEIAGLARSGIAALADTATAMLGVKTLADAIEINARFARHSVDALIGSSAKLSEIGVNLAADASRPILSRLGEGWRGSGL